MLLPESSRPLYEQLKLTLINDIESEVYKHGERLPSEMMLAGKFGISRITVRRALSELVAEGYLSSQQGKGTFVDYINGEYRHLSFGTFYDTQPDPAKKKSSHILAREIQAVGPTIGKYLRLPADAQVMRLRRLMSEEGKPYMIDTAFLRLDLYPGIPELVGDNVSTFDLIRGRYGIEFAKAEKSLSVVRAGLEESRLLRCVPGDPLFSTSKVIYDPSDRPVHYSHYLVLGDRCVYTLMVTSDMADMQIHYRDD